MKFIKKRILKIANKILQHSEVYSLLDNIKKKQERAIRLQHLIMPAVLPLEGYSQKIFQQINNDPIYSSSNLNISKNDLMFLFWLHQSGNIEDALSGYFRTGLLQADIVRKLIHDFFLDNEKVKLLDFASGHGRVSRYFKNFLSSDLIDVADIKANAVEFQNKEFGYSGFVAPDNPSILYVDKGFDLIVVSSLFTHLDKKLFSGWLKSLWNLLDANGILAISVHLIEENQHEKFNYSEQSEDDLFPETSESLSGKNIYGLTHLNRSSLNEILKAELQSNYEVIAQMDWAGSQVLLCIKKTESAQ